MKEVFQNINWLELLSAIWTIVLVPILTKLYSYLKDKKLDKYALILYREVKNAVKSVYETEVKDIKGTDAWTEDKMNEVKEIAKQKAIQALNQSVYKCLKEANSDFEDYLDSLITTSLYDLKHEK